MKEMDLIDHLSELRKRIIRIVFIIAASFAICYGFGEIIAELLLAPLRAAIGSEGKIVYLGLLDKVLAQFQLAFWSSVLFSSPLWFFQLWQFVKPGLYDHEIKVIRPFALVGFFLFCAGVSFGYFVVFPFTFETLLNFGVKDIEATLSLKDYLVLSSKVLVFLGVLFQLPNLMLILGFMELITVPFLNEMRRYIYVAFAIISAILTPPDVITLAALWVPLVCLFEVGVLAVALIVHPYLKRKYIDQDAPPNQS